MTTDRSYAAKLWLTNAMNHIVENLGMRIQWYIWALLDTPAIINLLIPAERKRLAINMRNCLVDKDYVHGVTQKSYSRAINNLHPTIRPAAVAAIDNVYNQVVQLFSGMPLNKYLAKRNWWSYIQPMHAILGLFENYQTQLQVQYQGQRFPRGRSVRRFTVLPISDMNCHYTTLDTRCLAVMLRHAGYHVPTVSEDISPEIARQMWALSFNVADAISNQTGRRRFAFLLETDGVGATIKIMRPADSATIDEEGFDENGIYHPLGLQPNSTLRTVDPGRKDIVEVCWGEQREDHLSISLKQYRNMCGFDRATVRRNQWFRDQNQQYRNWAKRMLHSNGFTDG